MSAAFRVSSCTSKANLNINFFLFCSVQSLPWLSQSLVLPGDPSSSYSSPSPWPVTSRRPPRSLLWSHGSTNLTAGTRSKLPSIPTVQITSCHRTTPTTTPLLNVETVRGRSGWLLPSREMPLLWAKSTRVERFPSWTVSWSAPFCAHLFIYATNVLGMF